MRDDDAEYQTWLSKVPTSVSEDLIWRLPAYRLGRYLASLATADAKRLRRSATTRTMSEQLLRSVGSITANIAEGYSRYSGRERARFYEYALGSVRESAEWYFIAAGVLDEETLQRRISVLTRVRRILAAVIPRERAREGFREHEPSARA